MSTGWTEAVCKAAGWPWCPEHERPRYHGSNPCKRLHQSADLHDGHSYDCPFGDPGDPHGDICVCGANFRAARTQEED